jgi:adenosylhomocysteine nucleosidase
MRILVTFALDAEFAPWRKIRSFKKLSQANIDCYVADYGGAEISAVLTGMGGKKAWVEATKILWDANVDVCISSGLAGGLKPEHRPGDILAAKTISASATEKKIYCDPALVETAVACGAKVTHFLSTDRVVVSSVEKRQLGLKADLVEMESAEVLSEAAAFGAKIVAIRAISDSVEEDLPLDFNRATTEEGDLSLSNVLGQVARNPSSIATLIRFGQQSRSAASRLAAFLDSYVEKVVSTHSVPLARGGSPV